MLETHTLENLDRTLLSIPLMLLSSSMALKTNSSVCSARDILLDKEKMGTSWQIDYVIQFSLEFLGLSLTLFYDLLPESSPFILIFFSIFFYLLLHSHYISLSMLSPFHLASLQCTLPLHFAFYFSHQHN